MLNCHPINLEDFAFEVIVDNPMQDQKLNEEGMNILNFLKSKLNNSKISMKIRISVDNERKVAFTPIEKFKIMSEKNDKLLLLKEKLMLDFS